MTVCVLHGQDNFKNLWMDSDEVFWVDSCDDKVTSNF